MDQPYNYDTEAGKRLFKCILGVLCLGYAAWDLFAAALSAADADIKGAVISLGLALGFGWLGIRILRKQWR
jgi:hypothetical protein